MFVLYKFRACKNQKVFELKEIIINLRQVNHCSNTKGLFQCANLSGLTIYVLKITKTYSHITKCTLKLTKKHVSNTHFNDFVIFFAVTPQLYRSMVWKVFTMIIDDDELFLCSVGNQFLIYSQIGIYSMKPPFFYNGKITDTHWQPL